jgi:opacity protein-like surface antigen
MSKFLSAFTAAAVAASFALPVSAAPISVPQPQHVKAGAVEQANHRRNWRDSHWNRRHAWRSCRYYGRCFPRYDYTQSYGYRDDYRNNRRPGVNIYLNF